MRTMKVILLGAGGVAREVMRRIGGLWSLVVVDPSEELLTQTKGVRPFEPIVGDPSSRVVLERAGFADADALIAATTDDEVNLEACRLAKSQGIYRILAVASRPERLGEYRELGIQAFAPAELVARRVELTLEARRTDSKAFAEGRVEAVEVRVSPDAQVRGKTLGDVGPASWAVGSVLRSGQLLDPSRATVLEEADLVTVVGPATDFTDIVKAFTSSEPRFPLDFGKRVAVALEDVSHLGTTFAEALNLVRSSTSSSVLVLHRDRARIDDGPESDRLNALLEGVEYAAEGVSVRLKPTEGKPSAELLKLSKEESIGVLVVPAPDASWLFGSRAAARYVDLARSLNTPILLSRGKIDYRTIVIPARDTKAGHAAARAAIDIAGLADAKLSAVAVAEPSFLGGPSAIEDAAEAIGWLREEAAFQGVDIQGEARVGNPVREFLEIAEDADLIVVGAGERSGLLSERVTRHLASRTKASVLIVPVI